MEISSLDRIPRRMQLAAHLLVGHDFNQWITFHWEIGSTDANRCTKLLSTAHRFGIFSIFLFLATSARSIQNWRLATLAKIESRLPVFHEMFAEAVSVRWLLTVSGDKLAEEEGEGGGRIKNSWINWSVPSSRKVKTCKMVCTSIPIAEFAKEISCQNRSEESERALQDGNFVNRRRVFGKIARVVILYKAENKKGRREEAKARESQWKIWFIRNGISLAYTFQWRNYSAGCLQEFRGSACDFRLNWTRNERMQFFICAFQNQAWPCRSKQQATRQKTTHEERQKKAAILMSLRRIQEIEETPRIGSFIFTLLVLYDCTSSIVLFLFFCKFVILMSFSSQKALNYTIQFNLVMFKHL